MKRIKPAQLRGQSIEVDPPVSLIHYWRTGIVKNVDTLQRIERFSANIMAAVHRRLGV